MRSVPIGSQRASLRCAYDAECRWSEQVTPRHVANPEWFAAKAANAFPRLLTSLSRGYLRALQHLAVDLLLLGGETFQDIASVFRHKLVS